MDGTFKAVPRLFSQLYTLHSRYMGQVFPFLFCLLTSRKKENYCRLLRLIKEKATENGFDFNPTKIIIDFERATIAAIHEILPNTVVRGCFFHYAQCVWRKVQELGLSTLYREDKGVKTWIRRAAAMPLVPIDNIEDVFLHREDKG